MASYGAYSRGLRRTGSQSKASDLFDQLLTSGLPSKPSNKDSCHEDSKESTPPAERTWSRRKYEYSFSPGSKVKSLRDKKASPTKLATKRKASVPDLTHTDSQTTAPKVPKLEFSEADSTAKPTCATVPTHRPKTHPAPVRARRVKSDPTNKTTAVSNCETGPRKNRKTESLPKNNKRAKTTRELEVGGSEQPVGRTRARRGARASQRTVDKDHAVEDDDVKPSLDSVKDTVTIASDPIQEKNVTNSTPHAEKCDHLTQPSELMELSDEGADLDWMEDSQITPELSPSGLASQSSSTDPAPAKHTRLNEKVKTKTCGKSSQSSGKSRGAKSSPYKSPLDEMFNSPKKQAAPESPLVSRYHSNTENPLIRIKKSSPIRRMEEKSESNWSDFVSQAVPPPVNTLQPVKLQVPKPKPPPSQRSKFKPSRVYSLVTKVPKDSPVGVTSASSLRKISTVKAKRNDPSPAKPQQSDNQVIKVRNVMSASECVQNGQNQQFFDDCRYLLESLRPATPLKSRCLGSLNLATQLLNKEFSQQFRAHGFASKIFTFLHNCPKYPVLLLSTAVLYYCLTRDPLNSQWDNKMLDVLYPMLSTTELTIEDSYNRVKIKCSTVLNKSHPQEPLTDEGSDSTTEYHVNPQSYTVCDLAREVLLSLSSPHHNPASLQRELRAVGALDTMANNVIEFSRELPVVTMATPSGDLEEQYATLNRWLKLVDNCCAMCSDNQTYLVVFDGSVLVTTLVRLLRGCFQSVCAGESSTCDVLLSVLRILLNLTHNNELCCDRVGSEQHITGALLHCVLQSLACLSKDQQFEIKAAALGVLINLTENNSTNRTHLENTTVEDSENSEFNDIPESPGSHGNNSSLIALVEMFLKFYNKAESTDIAMPSPQRLSQLSNSPSQTSSTVHAPSAAKRNLTTALSASHKATSSGESPSHQPSQSTSDGLDCPSHQPPQSTSDGLDWLPDNEGDESEDEEDYEPIPTDPLVFSKKEFDTALSQAGRHLEDSIIASYCALLIGILVQHNSGHVDCVKDLLPSRGFSEMIGMLGKFISFMSMTGSTTGLDSIRAIKTHLQDMSRD